MNNTQQYPPLCPHCGQFNPKIIEVAKETDGVGGFANHVWLHYPDGGGQTLLDRYLENPRVLADMIRNWAAAHIEAAFAAGVASVKGGAQ